MNKEKKLGTVRISNYEVLCIVRDCTPEQKSFLLEKIKKSILPEEVTIKSEVKKLAYTIDKMETAEYLQLNFKADRTKIAGIEEVLKNQLIVRHMTINLDTEKKIKIKDSDRIQRNRRFKKPGFKVEKRPLVKSDKEVADIEENKAEVNN